jgi:hypothetical protein
MRHLKATDSDIGSIPLKHERIVLRVGYTAGFSS